MPAWWEGRTNEAIRVPVTAVHAAGTRMLGRHGVPADDAADTLTQLIEADLRGYPSHGVVRIRQIAEMLTAGTLVPAGEHVVTSTVSACAVIDAGGGLGPPAAVAGIDLARRMAATTGVAVVGIRDAGHLGILATWAERLAGDDSFALVVSSSEPGVVVPGGATPIFGTNPIAYAWPGISGPVSADFSTAAITRSELLRRAGTGEGLPAGVANDADGRPTISATAALGGGLLPIGGGHKGALLSLLTAVLAGPLVGGPDNLAVTGTRKTASPPHKADFLCVIRLDAMTTRADFDRDMHGFLAAASAGGDFHQPGQRSWARRARALTDGIELDAELAVLLDPDLHEAAR